MRHVEERVDILNRFPRPWRIAALADALVQAADDETRFFADHLVKELEGLPDRSLFLRASDRARIRSQGIRALIQSWPRLGDQPRRDIRECIGDQLFESLVAMAEDEDDRTREAAAIAAPLLVSPMTVAALPKLLLDDDEEVALAAEAAFVDLASITDLNGPTEEALDAALVDAATSYPDHRLRGVMFAIARKAARPGKAVAAWLQDGREPGHMALRAVIRQATDPRTRADCIRWLACEALAPAALDRLGRSASSAEHETALGNWHLLLHPARRARLRSVARPRELFPAPEVAAVLSERALRGRLELTEAVRLPRERRAELFGESLLDGSVANRLKAVRALAGRASVEDEASDVLADFAFDPDSNVAEAAMFAWVGESRAGERVRLSALSRSPHERVRSMAQEARSWGDPWDQSAPKARRGVAARRAMEQDRDGFLQEIRERIRAGDGDRTMDAIHLASRIESLAEVELELLACAASSDLQCAATAIKALRVVTTSASMSARLRAIEHGDARVRANAVESVSHIEGVRDLLADLLADGHHRVRANAIRACLTGGYEHRAVSALAEMLADDRERHKEAAIWLVERAGRVDLAERIAELARSDGEESMRDRARACARGLLARMRADWSTPSAEPMTPMVV